MTAFAIRNLSVLSYAQGFTAWHYRHPGPLDEVSMPGFFDIAADMFAPGDHISISAADGGAILFVRKPSPKTVETVPMASTGVGAWS